MEEISLCMIVKNERETLPRCLDSAKGAVDEIIIVDTGSSDGTQEIAARYTDRVFSFEWCDDFSAARNAALQYVTRDFWMWLDADDVLEDADALVRFKREDLARYDMVMTPYHAAFDGQGLPLFTYSRERILRTAMDFRWEGAVHEAIAPRGRVGHAAIAVRHEKTKPGEPGRNLRIYEKLKARGHSFNARERFYYGRELSSAGHDGEAAAQLQSVVADENAWIENRIEACMGLADCLDRLGNAAEAMRALCGGLALDRPRAALACALGRRFLAGGNLRAARFWYEAALACEDDERSGAFVQRDQSGYIPLLQLCVIADRMGEYKAAYGYNERAGLIKPGDAVVARNRRYFEQVCGIGREGGPV